MMNYFVVIGDDEFASRFGPPIQFEDQTHAAEFCHQVGISHFYEVCPVNPMEPVRLWELIEAPSEKSYRLKARRWIDVIQEHDGCGCGCRH